MARPLRVEYPGAYYHVINRGNNQEKIFKNDRDKEKFLQYLEKANERFVDSIIPDEILSFLTKLIGGTKQTVKRNRYSSLKAFFNYIKNSIDSPYVAFYERKVLPHWKDFFGFLAVPELVLNRRNSALF